ncbi:MAG: hypothetical protein JNM52_06070 [Betaproteobacteria bacterium]|nr:hypothetical protein [Betaproteobacteria bacterium]
MPRPGGIDSPGRFAQALKRADELVGINNKDVSLAIVAAHAHRLMALSLWQANRRADVTEHVAAAINMMAATHQAKPTAETQAAYAEVLLTSAELGKATGKPTSEIEATCLKAQGILAKEALNSTYYRILDPWVRAHACLKQPEKVAQHQARLTDMGYRATEYTRFLSHNPERKL